MGPNGSAESLQLLIELILNKEAAHKRVQSTNLLRKRLQSIIFFPPQSEPSSRETRQKWERVLQRRRIENQTVVAEELAQRDVELQALSKVDNTDLWKNIDSIRAFLLELHSPPSPESHALAIELREVEKRKLHAETQEEIDLKLYKTIMESEPLVGDHWQTDIYAGSSSSLNSSTPSDWSSDSDHGGEKTQPASASKDLLPKSVLKADESATFLELMQAEDQKIDGSNQGLQKLQDLTRDAYWLKSATETAMSQMPELIIVREVLAALLNVGGDLIYTASTDSKCPTTLSENAPTLFCKSRATSLSLLSSFLPILNSLEKLRNQSQLGLHVRKQNSLTEEAFAASLLHLLQGFDAFVTSIELQLLGLPGAHNINDIHNFNSESVVSLMRLYHQLDRNGWIELFTTLACATPDSHIQDSNNENDKLAVTKVLLDKLYKLACRFDSHCTSVVAVERMKIVFLKTCEPVWAWVGDWIIYGQLPGPASTQQFDRPPNDIKSKFDFFVSGLTPGASNPAEDWWDDRYSLKENSIPEFLQDFAADILEGGKAKAMSRVLTTCPDTETPQWPKLAQLMTQPPEGDTNSSQATNPTLNDGIKGHLRRTAPSSRYPRTADHISSIQADVWAPGFNLELYSRIKQSLTPLISFNHSSLRARFFSPLKLSTYMNELNDFFLLGSKSSKHFLKKIFDDANDFSKSNLLSAHPLLNTTHWWEDQVINANLSKALEYSPSPILSSCLLKIKTLPSIRSEDPIKCLQSIAITFSIPKPLNYVFKSAHVSTYYNKCFVFLSQLARATWTLDSLIWVKPTLPLGSNSTMKEFEKRAESKEFYRLKNRLAWFVNLMTDYCMSLVVLKWKINFVEAIDHQAGDLSQTIHHTKRWLDRLLGLMFLSDHCQPLNQVILQVLGLCIKSHETWAGFNRRANTLRLIDDINQDFVNTERRKRKIERRNRRMRNEQYSLIEEESRHIDDNLDNPVISSIEGVTTIVGEEVDETYDQSANPEYHSVSASLPETYQNLQHMMIDQDQENYLVRFQKMNVEFERLLIFFQRGVGKLCRRIAVKIDHNKNPSEPFKSSSTGSNNTANSPQDHSGTGLESSEDLDTLTLLECRLDEWVV